MSVVLVSFRQAVEQEWKWVATGSPFVEIELLGEKHSLKDAVKSLFKYYLRDVRREELSDHSWDFVPEEDDRLALDVHTPLLSEYIIARETSCRGSSGISRRITMRKGSQMTFVYDYGTPTTIAVKIEDITEKPEDIPEESYPREKAGDLIASTASGGTAGLTVDQAFPELAAAALSKRFQGSFFGHCTEDLHGCIEGGPADNGDQLFAPLAFDSIEDYLICCNKAWPTIRKETTDEGVQEGWVCLLVAPPQQQGHKEESKLEGTRLEWERIDRFFTESSGRLDYDYKGPERPTEMEEYMMCGPKQVFCRLTVEELAAERAALREKGFDLATLFPTMCATLAKASARRQIWFKIYQQRLMVAAGMGMSGAH